MTGTMTVLKIGDTAPEFDTGDFTGKPVNLPNFLAEGPVVLIFLRGFG